jgi:hypothetical protein
MMSLVAIAKHSGQYYYDDKGNKAFTQFLNQPCEVINNQMNTQYEKISKILDKTFASLILNQCDTDMSKMQKKLTYDKKFDVYFIYNDIKILEHHYPANKNIGIHYLNSLQKNKIKEIQDL